MALLRGSLASSFGDELDLSMEDGKSASTGCALGFGLDTGGGDFEKKLKSELCFAMKNLDRHKLQI